MRCLLIDDNPIDLLVNEKVVLSIKPDANITKANSAQQALEFLQQPEGEAPDIILLDIKMPFMDGFEFIQELKVLNLQSLKNCRIFLVSSSLDPDDQSRAENNPLVYDFLEKPLRTNDLKERLRTAPK